MPENPDELLTLKEAAAILKVTTRTLLRRIEEGKLPAQKLGTGRTSPLRVKRSDLDKLLNPARPAQDESSGDA
ncbi:MAG: helix-turn-helix domain-containing protein [Anaerolineae bacterium]|nr:helix-turn-helix domain-containing protein [Anaerolineae bacterium]